MIISPTKKIHFPGKPYNNSDIFFSDYDNYKRTITASAMKALEQQADQAGLSFRDMMYNAGAAACKSIQRDFAGKNPLTIVFAGPGNNGGDGYIAAGLLAITACTSEPEFQVNGNISGAEGKMLYIEASTLEGIAPLDSVKLKSDGRYSFGEPRPKSPEFLPGISGSEGQQTLMSMSKR